MDYKTLRLNELRPGINVRTVVDEAADASLQASIATLGLLSPLIVMHDPVFDEPAPYRIVAGHRRFAALCAIPNLLANNYRVAALELPEDADDAAIQAAENICRQNLSDSEFLAAFKRMAGTGQSSMDIAETFGVTTRKVDQLLALANADEFVLDEWKAGNIDRDCAEVLTQLLPSQLTAWRVAYDANEWWSNKGASVRKHLLDKAQISVTAALFDVTSPEAQAIPRSTDLFREGDDVVFTDAVAFWNLQDKAISERAAALETMGFMSVEVVRTGTDGALSQRAVTSTIAWARRMNEADTARCDALEVEKDGLNDKVNAGEMAEDVACDREETIDNEIYQIEQGVGTPDGPELNKTGRCYLFVHPTGQVVEVGPALTWKEHGALRSAAITGKPAVLELAPAEKRKKIADADGFRVTAAMAALLVRGAEAGMFGKIMLSNLERDRFVFHALVQHVGIKQVKRPAGVASSKGWIDAMATLAPVLKKASLKRMREVGAYFGKDDVDWKAVADAPVDALRDATASLCFLATGCANDEVWPSKVAPIFSAVLPAELSTIKSAWRPDAAWLSGLSTKGLIFVGKDAGYSGRRTAMDLTKLKKEKIIPFLAEYFADATTPAWVPKSLRPKVKKPKAATPPSEAEAQPVPMAEAAE